MPKEGERSMNEETKTVSKSGFIVACMNCHGGKGTAVDTREEAQTMADIHLRPKAHEGHKSHAGHVVAIIPAELVRRKK
jgi:hypothetical protein